ncbi:hypothetical protein JCM19231_1918 [Vibrio ishigakensis]|uniref:Uncharacterized protein n=1 Tax=Vibrio ishigakensis TaxID=1481914 RepID=A0A0B8NS11_9VIBR|nr:hypothetical protein JCM19231_1918 [Vibrio ishigakensis]
MSYLTCHLVVNTQLMSYFAKEGLVTEDRLLSLTEPLR